MAQTLPEHADGKNICPRMKTTMGVQVDRFGDPYFFNGPLDAQLLQG